MYSTWNEAQVLTGWTVSRWLLLRSPKLVLPPAVKELKDTASIAVGHVAESIVVQGRAPDGRWLRAIMTCVALRPTLGFSCASHTRRDTSLRKRAPGPVCRVCFCRWSFLFLSAASSSSIGLGGGLLVVELVSLRILTSLCR